MYGKSPLDLAVMAVIHATLPELAEGELRAGPGG